jgi:hypothetical protein
MSKRLQVLLEEAEFREIRRVAKRNGMTVADRARQAPRAARRREPAVDTLKKLETVRAAARHAYPTADIETMLGEIERGYLGGSGS